MVGSVRRVAVEWQWNGLAAGEADEEDAEGQPSTESESAQSAQSRLLPLPHSSSMPLSLGEADRGRTGRIGRRIPMHTEAAFTTARHSVIPCNSRISFVSIGQFASSLQFCILFLLLSFDFPRICIANDNFPFLCLPLPFPMPGLSIISHFHLPFYLFPSLLSCRPSH